MKKYEDWIQLEEIFGNTSVPPQAAFVIANAIEEAIRRGDIRRGNRWQILEYWAADYLMGG